MAYSITPILHQYKDSKNRHKLLIRVIYNRKYAYASLDVKLEADQLQNGVVVNHPNKTKINAMIRSKMAELEDSMLDFVKLGSSNIEDLKRVVSGEKATKDKFPDFISTYNEEVEGKQAPGTIAINKCIKEELERYDPHLYFHKINETWLNTFEQEQRKLCSNNTVNKKMKVILRMLRKASKRGLIKKERFENYVMPKYVPPIPVYLEEHEMIIFKKICDAITQPKMKMSGYYFLLSCYAGYRISDFKVFDYQERVHGNKILLTTKKNKRMVSMPIHTRLREILEYCRDNPHKLSEQKTRLYVKQIAQLAGVARKVKVHTARHSFAMMLMDNGFDLEEVAELLGVSVKTASVYARISNKRLEKKVLEKLG